jgi:hypothetical protein|tara:strand:+ start:23 stop:142 length:120 start_codon:yes stop_codon:yes gene_type:complete
MSELKVNSIKGVGASTAAITLEQSKIDAAKAIKDKYPKP